MSYTRILLYAFNRGIISALGLARFDLKRLALSAEICTNWMFRTLGSMMLRPGLGYIDSTYSNLKAVHIPFIFSVTDTAIIELTNNLMRVRINEAVISRVAVSTVVANGNPFVAGLTSWTDADDAGGNSVYTAPYMSLSGNGTARAVRYQNVTVAGGDVNKEHGLRIVVAKGYVTLRVGTAAGDDSYIGNTILNPGIHSLALTPTGNFTIQLSSATVYTTLVTSVNIEGAGAMTIATPWTEAMLPYVRKEQSADVIFIASDGTVQQRRIERRSKRSWSVVLYLADDGPFLNQNIDRSIKISSSALNGDVTLTSNIPFFKQSHAGALFSLLSESGSTVLSSVSGNGQFSNPIEVTGVGTKRNFTVNITGTWVGAVTIQYSVGAPGAWIDFTSYAVNQTNTVLNDGFDNQIIFYRIGFGTGYTSGTAVVSLSFSLPSNDAGIVRIDSVTNSTTVVGHVLKDLSSIVATPSWSEGLWSLRRGYPTANCLYEGRLWWFGQDYIAGSVSDAYSSYDQTIEGASAPIVRTISQGAVSVINWALGLQRLIVGCDGSENSVRSDSLDTLLSTTNFNIKSPSTRGSAAVAGEKIDTNGIFVQRGDPDSSNTSGSRLIEIAYQGTYAVVDYTTSDLTMFCPELVAIGIKRIAVQRKIDTRIHCLLTDGTVAVCIYEPLEKEKGLLLVTTDGIIEDILVLPGGVEDKVYYVVARQINGSTVRYLERYAMESECAGGTVSKNSDAHIVITNLSPSTAISAPHLAGEMVTVWADGKDVGTDENGDQIYTLDGSGHATLAAAATSVVIGKYYDARFKSVKLTQTVQDGTSMGLTRNIESLGVVLGNTHYQGLKYGKDFDSLEPLPLVEDGRVTPADTVWSEYDKTAFTFPGEWGPDERVCLLAASPRPCTILGANIGVSTSDR